MAQNMQICPWTERNGEKMAQKRRKKWDSGALHGFSLCSAVVLLFGLDLVRCHLPNAATEMLFNFPLDCLFCLIVLFCLLLVCSSALLLFKIWAVVLFIFAFGGLALCCLVFFAVALFLFLLLTDQTFGSPCLDDLLEVFKSVRACWTTL